MIILPNTSFTFASDNSPAGVPVKIQVGVTVMQITFYKIPYMPTYLFRQLRGMTNQAPFLGAPTGCVLFKGARTNMTWNANAAAGRTIQLIFHERTQPWNQVFRRDKMAWDTLQDSNGNNLYTQGDLSQLVRFGPSS